MLIRCAVRGFVSPIPFEVKLREFEKSPKDKWHEVVQVDVK